MCVHMCTHTHSCCGFNKKCIPFTTMLETLALQHALLENQGHRGSPLRIYRLALLPTHALLLDYE